MRYLWDIYDIFMRYSWDVYEIFMRYLWDIYPILIFMRYLSYFNIYKIFILF